MFADNLPLREDQKKSDDLKGLFPIERKIVEKIYQISWDEFNKGVDDVPQWSSGQWTGEIKKCLHEIGKNQGYDVWPIEVEAEGVLKGEWLFDMVWVDAPYDCKSQKYDWEKMRRIALACECEWTTGKGFVLEDFLKLTVVVSDLRLFIYTNLGDSRVVEWCKGACPLSQGFRYLTIGIPNKACNGIQVDAWTA